MDAAILLDCEWLTAEGAPRRFWCGPSDPDPIVVQIGAVKLGLMEGFDVLETLDVHVRPIDRHGRPYPLDPLFTRLTGIDKAKLAERGRPLAEALDLLADFADGCRLWSWGKDELNAMAISAYVAGIAPTVPAHRFSNAVALMLKAGMPEEDTKRVPSNELAAYFGLPAEGLRGHDALDDARSLTYAVQHLLRERRLGPCDLTEPSLRAAP